MPESKPVKPTLDDEEGPDASLRKLTSSPGVSAYIVLNRSGIPIKSFGVDSTDALHYAALLSELTLSTQSFLTHSSHLLTTSSLPSASALSSDLQSLRLKSKKCELIVTVDDNYTLIVVQSGNGTGGGVGLGVVEGVVEGGEKKEEKKKAVVHEEKESD